MKMSIDNPTLKGKRVVLSPPDDESISFLYRVELDISEKFLWTDERVIPDGYHFKDDFIRQLKSYYHVFLMIYVADEKIPAGFIYSYNFNRTDGFLHSTIYVDKKYRSQFVGAEAGILFHDYLFQYYPLRKVYSTVFGYNQTSLKFLLSAGFVIEGEFKQHRYYAGDYHSMFTLALYKDAFYQRCGVLLNSFKKIKKNKRGGVDG